MPWLNLKVTPKGVALGFCAVFTVSVLLIIFTPISNYMASPLVVDPEPRRAELIAVLGGGAHPNGVLGGGSSERFLHGLRLYKQGYGGEVLFVGGSILKPTKKVLHTVTKSEDASEIDVAEAALMHELSMAFGMDPGKMHQESASTHTYENIVAIKDFMEVRGIKDCLIVTSPTHSARSISVALKLGLDCTPATVPDYTPHISSALGRLSLLHAVLWEYAGLFLYKAYGYI